MSTRRRVPTSASKVTPADCARALRRFPIGSLVLVKGSKEPHRVVQIGTADQGLAVGIEVSWEVSPPRPGYGQDAYALEVFRLEDVAVYVDPKWSLSQKDAAVRRADPASARRDENLAPLKHFHGLFLRTE